MHDTWIIEGKYEVISKIKQGGFGIVYYGFDRKFEKPIAIKAIEPGLLQEAKYIDMFLVEAKNAAKLNHNNIVHVYDLIKTNDAHFYIIMEYIDGFDMRRVIKRCKSKGIRIPIELSLYLMKELCKALEYAHNKRDILTKESLNLVHQDISPSNILVSVQGTVKLIDFGIAKIKFHHNGNIILAGKLPYMAPDQLNGAIIDKRTDLFSLGTVFFEMLTNEMLFSEENDDKTVEAIKRKRIDNKFLSLFDIPEPIQQILIKSLQKDPDERYQGANEIYIDIVEYLMSSKQSVELSVSLGHFIQDIFKEEISRRSETTQQEEIEYDEDILEIKTVDDNTNELTDAVSRPEATALDVSPEMENVELPDLSELKTKPLAVPIVADLKTEVTEINELPPQLEKSNIDQPQAAVPQNADLLKQEAELVELTKDLLPSTNSQQPPSKVEKIKKITPPINTSYGDEEEVEDDIKTVIDVIRLSAKTHKKPLILSLIGICAAFFVFMILNISFRWTTSGERIYDYLFPPAIKILSVPAGAQVYIDDKLLSGKTPLNLKKIAPGVHYLKLTYANYPPLVKSLHVPSKGAIKVAGEETRKGYEPYLFRFKTQIELNSDPIGATIILNNVKYNQGTPTTIEWEVGTPLNIEMNKQGFQELTGFSINTEDESIGIEDNRLWNFSILEEGGVKKYIVQGLFKKFVNISSLPDDVTFYLDGSATPTGKTGSAQAIALSVGSHDILFTKSGFNSRRITVNVDENGPKSIFVALTRNVRFFAKDATVPNDNDIGASIVRIYRQGQSYSRNDQTPCEIALPLVNHKVLLKKEGYNDAVVLVSPNSKVIVAKMEPQNSAIEISVFDALSGQPIAEAAINYINLNSKNKNDVFFGSTNNLGKCKNKLEPGQYTFTVKKLGYFEKSANLNTLSGQKKLEIKLIIQ